MRHQCAHHPDGARWHQPEGAGLASASPGSYLLWLLNCHIPPALLELKAVISLQKDPHIPYKLPWVFVCLFCVSEVCTLHIGAFSTKSLGYIWSHLNRTSNLTFLISLQTFSQLFLSSLSQGYAAVSYHSWALLLGAQAALPGGVLQRAATAVVWEGQKEMTGQAGAAVWQETGLDWWL